MSYIIGIDQSTQGTKVLLFDGSGKILCRADRPHRQIINEAGWVSHDMDEVYRNMIDGLKEVLEQTGIDQRELAGVGISNQRETTVAWGADGKPLAPAVVWQCGRAAQITERLSEKTPEAAERIRRITGLPLSPYFPAAKMAWLLENDGAVRSAAPVSVEETSDRTACPGGQEQCRERGLHLGTVDSYLGYRLTGGKVFATDYSNASRTQLFDLHTLTWSREACDLFGVPAVCLPEVRDSNGDYGVTDFDGLLEQPIPILAVLGDSHAALFGQGCHERGMMKTTYGTGSSMMLNAGEEFVASSHGLATSLAWGIDGRVSYVLEGNINYTGAIMSWLKDDLGLIASTGEIAELIPLANPADTTVIVPAFTGLGAPYWSDSAKAAIVGMTRTTKKAEIVKAATESIAMQIADVFAAMEQDFGGRIKELRADGGPTKNTYLMQFQSDMIRREVLASQVEELSAVGAAYLAGITAGCSGKDLFGNITYESYLPQMEEAEVQRKHGLWDEAVKSVLG